MKKRLITAFLTLLALAALAPAAFAAVETGGVKYLWTTANGNAIYGEYNETIGDYEIVGYRGQKFLISADGGASYAELPGLREQSEKVWSNYRMRVLPLDNGGLRLEGWGEWETEVTWLRDYTAAEIAAALKNAVAVPVRVWCTNGTVTLATRYVSDNANDDPSIPSWQWGSRPDREETVAGDHLLWSADGVTWNDTGLLDYEPWYEDGAFYNYDYFDGVSTSTDGVHWTKIDERRRSTKLRYACDLGKYHFEVVNAEDWQNGNDVYLMDQTNRESGVLLPDLGKAIRAMGIGVGDIQAWYTPNDTVTVAVYDYNQEEKFMYSLTYPISSLDWCLENLSKPFRTIEVKASDGEVSLGLAAPSNVGWFREEGSLLRNDGSGWKPVTGMYWGNTLEVLPYNGKTFLVQDTAALRLYASEDGLNWVEVGSLKPEGMESDSYDFINYSFAWTGKEYIACRKAYVRRHGMMGMSGGKWYEGNTKVYFLNDAFQITNSYDFGRLVEKVAFLDGAYYAQVSNSDGQSEHEFNDSKGSTIYRSTDGKTWTALGKEYFEMNDILIEPAGGSRQGNFPTGDPNKPLRSVAQAGPWRFALKQGWYDDAAYPRLVTAGTFKYTRLTELAEKVKAGWITPGTLTAELLEGGGVRLTVADLYTPTMTCQHTYTAGELEALAALNGDDTRVDYYQPEEQVEGQGVYVGLMERAGGERELTYRTVEMDKWLYLEQVPWSNSIVLLPYSGKDFFLLDKADGKVYRSADGKSWVECTGTWIVENQDWGGNAEYALAWAGDRYLACCIQTYNSRVGGGVNQEHQGMVYLLDEDLNLISSTRLDVCGVPECNKWHMIDQVGYRDGVCYAQALKHMDEGSEETVYRSADGGKTWEKTDIIQVRKALGLSL